MYSYQKSINAKFEMEVATVSRKR